MSKLPASGARAAAKRATRKALIDAAYAEISQHGPSAPSLDAICARAGFTRGAFYVHFRDREDLLVAVMDRVLGDMVQAVTGAGQPGQAGGLAAGIRYFTRAAAERDPSVFPDRALRFQHLLEACRSSPAIGARYRMIMEGARGWARAAVEDDQRAGRARADVAAPAVAGVMLAAGLGLVAMLELGIAPDPEALGETLLALLAPPRRTPPRSRRGAGRSPRRRRS